jgi:hypothetical protein
MSVAQNYYLRGPFVNDTNVDMSAKNMILLHDEQIPASMSWIIARPGCINKENKLAMINDFTALGYLTFNSVSSAVRDSFKYYIA